MYFLIILYIIMKRDLELFAKLNIRNVYILIHGLVAKSRPTLEIPWNVVCQVFLFVGFPRHEYWSGLPFSSPILLHEGR